jgi:transcription termination factor NusB
MLDKFSREVFIELLYQFLVNPNVLSDCTLDDLIGIILTKDKHSPKKITDLDISKIQFLIQDFNAQYLSEIESDLKKHLKDFKKTPDLVKSVLICSVIESRKLEVTNLKTLSNKYIKYSNTYCFPEESKLVHAVLTKFFKLSTE